MSQIQTPPPLQPGDKIAIVATARKVSRTELLPAIKLLRDWGFAPIEGQNLYAEDHQFAGPDFSRAADINTAIQNPEIKAILLARGGYGTVRIIDTIDYKALVSKPKWIIGFSDATILLNHLVQFPGIESIHGPMALTLPKADIASQNALLNIFSGKSDEILIPEHPFNMGRNTEGVLIGGNLSVLYSMLGSDSLPDPRGKILFLEDLDEYLYHIDRMMMGLKRSGFLNGLAAIVVGGMTDMKDNAVAFGSTAEQIIHHHISGKVDTHIFGVPSGHINNNYPLVIGRKYNLEKKGQAWSLTPVIT